MYSVAATLTRIPVRLRVMLGRDRVLSCRKIYYCRVVLVRARVLPGEVPQPARIGDLGLLQSKSS